MAKITNLAEIKILLRAIQLGAFIALSIALISKPLSADFSGTRTGSPSLAAVIDTQKSYRPEAPSPSGLRSGADRILRFVIYLSILPVAIVASAALVEMVLAHNDASRNALAQTFATVGKARIRYRLMGSGHPGPVVIFLSGLNGSIEQSDALQSAISQSLPSLAYDRGGYGFSRRSSAHSAEEQANELFGLLQALRINSPVMLVAYSFSGSIARVFADRFPQKTAAMYLIEPSMAELLQKMPELNTERRHWMRFVGNSLLHSSVGYIRLKQRLRNWQGPASAVEQRAEAILARQSHYWALAREWYAIPLSEQQVLASQVPSSLPLEIAFSKPAPDKKIRKTLAELYVELATRSTRGRTFEFEGAVHTEVMSPGPIQDLLVARINLLAEEARVTTRVNAVGANVHGA